MPTELKIENASQYELYKRSLESEYTTIKQIGAQLLLNEGVPQPDIDLFRDTRRSLFVYYSPPDELRNAVDLKILQPARELFARIQSQQGIYKPEWLHLSLFIVLASETPEEEKPLFDKIPDYYNAVAEALSEVKPVEVVFNRVITSPAGIILGGTPKSLEIQRARARLYQQFERYNLNYYYRRPPFIAHMTLSRWQSALTPENGKKVLEFCESLDKQEIWRGTLDTVKLAIGGYVMDSKDFLVIDKFKLR